MSAKPHTSSAKHHAKDAADSLWQAMEQIRASVEMKVATRMGKGDVRAAILTVLADEPMHGYQIMRKIEELTDGAWKPSAGSVYPTLQLMADEGLVTSKTSNDRKIYSLTTEGTEAAAATDAPWKDTPEGDTPGKSGLSKAGVDLARAITVVMRSGSDSQQAEVVELLDGTRRKIYSILAQD